MKQYGLIFDVDGVIADTEAVNARVSIGVFEDLFGLYGVKREDFAAGLGRGAADYVRAAARVHGLQLSDEQIERATALRQEYFLKVLNAEPLPPLPGVMELIDAGLASDDFRLAIATSGTLEKSRAVLDATGVPYGRMVYVNGSNVKNKKPDPELFLAAIRRLALPADRCVVIEDAPNGIEAALAAGARVVAVTTSTTEDNLADAHLIVDSLEELDLNMLRNLIDP